MQPITPPLMMLFANLTAASVLNCAVRPHVSCNTLGSAECPQSHFTYALGADVRKADSSSAAISQRYLWLCSTSKG